MTQIAEKKKKRNLFTGMHTLKKQYVEKSD